MCRGEEFCLEFNKDPAKWDKECPLRPPEWINSCIDIFVEALDNFLAGKRSACLEALEKIEKKEKEFTEWYIEHGQISGNHRVKHGTPGRQMFERTTTEQSTGKLSSELTNQILQRDNYHCRYCGCRLIDRELMQTFVDKLQSPLLTRGRTNLEKHGVILATWPLIDHVVPFSQGGKSTEDNLVSACYSCNFGKDRYNVEQLQITDPRERPPLKDGWDGLLSRLAAIKELPIETEETVSEKVTVISEQIIKKDITLEHPLESEVNLRQRRRKFYEDSYLGNDNDTEITVNGKKIAEADLIKESAAQIEIFNNTRKLRIISPSKVIVHNNEGSIYIFGDYVDLQVKNNDVILHLYGNHCNIKVDKNNSNLSFFGNYSQASIKSNSGNLQVFGDYNSAEVEEGGYNLLFAGNHNKFTFKKGRARAYGNYLELTIGLEADVERGGKNIFIPKNPESIPENQEEE